MVDNDNEKPVTRERLQIELQRFRNQLDTERLERQHQRLRWQTVFAIAIYVTALFVILYLQLKP